MRVSKLVTIIDDNWVYWTGTSWSTDKSKSKLYTKRGAFLAQTRLLNNPKHIAHLRDLGAPYSLGYRVEVW